MGIIKVCFVDHLFCINRNKKSHTSDSNSTFQNLSVNTINTSNVSSNQSQSSGSRNLQQNLDVLYQNCFPPVNSAGYPPTSYQMTVPFQTCWQSQTTSSWSTSSVTQTQQFTNIQTQTPLAEIKPEMFPQNLIKKQNDHNLIDLNFFDNIDTSKRDFSTVSTSVLEAFDPLLHVQSNMSSSETESTCICFY